jgi:hypothetical protein
MSPPETPVAGWLSQTPNEIRADLTGEAGLDAQRYEIFDRQRGE